MQRLGGADADGNTVDSELAAALVHALGTLSGQSVLFAQAVAQRLGMHPSDLECLGFLADEGSATAGRLAELTGLTTGAVTRMIDRLERAGYVRRLTDATDRRRVIIEPMADRLQGVAPQYAALQHAFEAMFATYSREQLDVVLDFMRSSESVMRAEVGRLNARTSQRA